MGWGFGVLGRVLGWVVGSVVQWLGGSVVRCGDGAMGWGVGVLGRVLGGWVVCSVVQWFGGRVGVWGGFCVTKLKTKNLNLGPPLN